MNIDLFLFQFINQFAGKSVCLDETAIFFGRYFEYFLIFILFLFLVKNFKKYWPMVIQAVLGAVLSRLIIVNIIRWLLPRPRPFLTLDITPLFYHDPAAASFPSGHAAFYFAIAAAVFFFFKKNQPRPRYWQGISFGFFLAAFLISLSRVFSGIHWPSDIIAGAVVGIFSGWLIIKIAKKFQK